MKLLCTSIALLMFGTTLLAQDLPNPQPTKAHKILADEAGTWDCEVKMFFEGPTGSPSESKGLETNELVSGGMYSRTTFKCKMGEKEFEGHGLVGYDPRSKEYTGTWVDNFSSIPSRMTGKYDADKKTLTMFSTVVDESGGELQQKQVTTFTDDETKMFEIFLLIDVGDQKLEVKLMEMTAKKRS